MKPVNQTRYGFGDNLTEAPGNCFAACLASIFELNLDQVPDEANNWKDGMTHDDSWKLYWEDISKWLRVRGYIYIEVPTNQLHIQASDWSAFDAYNIIEGPSPRDTSIYHAVVGKGVNIIHDPHPSNDGLLSVEGKNWYFGLFVPIDAGRMEIW